jgi:hypothetical protein
MYYIEGIEAEVILLVVSTRVYYDQPAKIAKAITALDGITREGGEVKHLLDSDGDKHRNHRYAYQNHLVI